MSKNNANLVAAALVLLGLAALACGYPQGLAPEAKDDYHHHDHYFQYINVPKHKHFEWGYKRGNDKHFREEYLTQHDHAFKAKLKWGDSYDGHGEMYYDYNHGPKYHDDHKGYHDEPKPVYQPLPPPAGN